jgi:7,8-dihydropterin-6-yl-methyl-4-(beta-D-ribofuranosyl)aminobenzene 5'-phosphate synthase
MIKVTCLIDNAVAVGSQLWGEHGLAFVIESPDGRVLFDTGASGDVLVHNLDAAGVDPASISAVALSHGHHDHTGGLAVFLAWRGRLPVYYAHPDLLLERGSERGGVRKPIGLPAAARTLLQDVDMRLSPEPTEILPGVWTTGEIRSRPEPEGRGSGHLLHEGEAWRPDPYRDDMSLVLEGAKGLVLLCGCSHAGILNIVLHVERVFGSAPVAIAGGMHLDAADDAQVRHVVEQLHHFGAPTLYPNHCTGQRAYQALAGAFPRVAPCPAATVIDV